MISPEQSRAARAWLDWSQDRLAKRANVSLSTVRDFEMYRRTPISNNLESMQRALEEAGVTFLFDGKESFGITFEDRKPRIREQDLIYPCLDILDDQMDGFMSISDLISAVELQFRPSGEDAEILRGRSDMKFSQIVRNIVSHRTSPSNLIGAGYAAYDKTRRGLTITNAGRAYLRKHAPRC